MLRITKVYEGVFVAGEFKTKVSTALAQDYKQILTSVMNSEWWVDLAKLDIDQEGILRLSLEEDHVILGPPGAGRQICYCFVRTMCPKLPRTS